MGVLAASPPRLSHAHTEPQLGTLHLEKVLLSCPHLSQVRMQTEQEQCGRRRSPPTTLGMWATVGLLGLFLHLKN